MYPSVQSSGRIPALYPQLILLIVALSPLFTNAGQGESWTINFQSEYSVSQSGPQGNVSITIKANGGAAIEADASGNFMGTGKVTINQTINGPNMKTQTSGQGSFQVKGKRSGNELVFWFISKKIPITGTITAAGMQMPYDDTFDVAIITGSGEEEGPAIKRENGAKTHFTSNVSSFSGEAVFTLSGGKNIVRETVAKGTFPDNPDIWTLEVQGNWSYPASYGGESCSIGGTAEFPLPAGDGPAKGEGPLKLTCDKMNAKGKMVLNGSIKKDTLTFIPRSDFKKANAATSGGRADIGFGSGLAVFDEDSLTMKVKNGAKHTKQFTQQGINGKVVWTLKGEKTEKWQAIMDGWNTFYFGDDDLAGGVKVLWKITVDFTLKNKHYHNGQGVARITNVTSHSSPPAVYNCNVPGTGKKLITNKSFNVTGKATSKQAVLFLPKDINLVVDYHCVMNIPQAKKALKGVGGMSVEDIIKGAKKNTTETGHTTIPGGQLLRSVRINLTDGWKSTYGRSNSLNFTKISVRKLR